MRIDKVGIDKVGIDEVGINQRKHNSHKMELPQNRQRLPTLSCNNSGVCQ